jgi:hypothetical protein
LLCLDRYSSFKKEILEPLHHPTNFAGVKKKKLILIVNKEAIARLMTSVSPTSTANTYSPIIQSCSQIRSYSSKSIHPIKDVGKGLISGNEKFYSSISSIDSAVDKVDDENGEICWFTLPRFPWSPSWLLSLRGAEYFHLYIWVLKDLSWAQSWYYSGHFFGSLAVFWSVYILSHAVHDRNINETFASVGQLLW